MSGNYRNNHDKRHTIGVLVENQPGVLSRVAGLFSGRGFNIESLTVAETNEPGMSRITLVTTGDEHIVEQIIKQLNKLINVIKVLDFRDTEFVEREMALIKVKADKQSRAEILRIVDIFRAKVVDVSPHSYIVEVTGDEGKIQAILDLLSEYGILELARTGKAAMARGKKDIQKR
ncbi:acetolactate synthase small subunit [Thermodesulforhabdus norvegica]|uniref:Acetolactate synthase small subunit n=1 Tax=Thermodesulforhabdus norvegica TaxID=39841 RepID=A0A1I4RKJ7_9BACT|nr:acetolactate synthase small subunit [Thermodesulforhabdus norvegica]SFM52616.1 acetolactate synthase, small subunit [Thermodesulforhabdus norvegica]